MPRQLPTTLRPRISRSSPRRKPPPSRSKSAAAVPDISAPSRTVRPPFRLFDPFSARLGTRLRLGYPLGLSASALKAELFGGYPSVSTQRLSRPPFVPLSPQSSIPGSIDIVSYLAPQRKWMRRLPGKLYNTTCAWGASEFHNSLPLRVISPLRTISPFGFIHTSRHIAPRPSSGLG